MKQHYKKILITFFFSFQLSFLNAQWVTIPDTNFVNWLNGNSLASCMNGNLMDTTCGVVVNASFVDCSSKNIYNLEGIQYFDNLQTLYCQINQLSNLPSLPNFLRELECHSNNLTSLPALPNTVYNLYCSYNLLNNLPALPDSLINLICEDNQLTSLPVLPDSLKYLICGYNQLTSLPALPNSLLFLKCEWNQITSLPSLPDSLEYLICANNQLTSLPTLPDSLVKLDCNSNSLTILPLLPSNLEILYCSDNASIIIPTLPDSLKEFECNFNQLNDLPLLPGSLEKLKCSFNLIDTLQLLPTSLRELECGNNQLSSLPALPNSLTYLFCAHNQLSSLPALPSSLTDLRCGANQLNNLPVLPDSLNVFHVGDNSNLLCLPELKRIVNFDFTNTGIQCLPNYGNVTTSNPLLSSLPLCDLFNINGCAAYWNISGKIYNDSNSNCIPGFNELRMPNLKLLLDSAGTVIQQTFTVGEGLYSFDTDTGTYTYTVDTTDLPVLVTCPAIGFQTSVLTATDSMDYDMDFGMQCKPGFDVGVTSVVRDSGVFRPANFAIVKISSGDISNLYGLRCAMGISGSVQVVFSGAVSYIASSAGALTPVVSGDTLLYSIADFGTVNFNSDFSFVMQTDTTAAIGSQICFDVNVTPTAGDINPVNNSLQQCFTVVNSVDPNTKEVFPEGNIDTSQHWLTYTINFQNTGTAPAQHIYILDTLDDNLDESSFTLLSYNHQPLTQVIGKVIRFNFPNINLPDSTNDEPNSHGYVQFKVKLKTGLTNGALIHNTANIYFDFNQPVTTNTTENQILITTGIEGFKVSGLRFKVVPNPAHDEVNIVLPLKGKFEIEIINTLGKMLIKKENQKRINISKLAKGLYFIKVNAGSNVVIEKFVKE